METNSNLYIDDNSVEDVLAISNISEDDPANRFISSTVMCEDPELLKIKQRVREVEVQAACLRSEQERILGVPKQNGDQQLPCGSQERFGGETANVTPKMLYNVVDNADQRSVYVGNVDYMVTHAQLSEHFASCGPVIRATIPKNRADNNHPKGYGYVEFQDIESMRAALLLHETMLNGRVINVVPKRSNRPGMSQTNRIPRGVGRGGFFAGAAGRGLAHQLQQQPQQLQQVHELQQQQQMHQFQQQHQPYYMYQPTQH